MHIRDLSILLLFILVLQCGNAQYDAQTSIDSILKILPNSLEDTNKVKLLNKLSYYYPYINPDEGLKYGNQSLEFAEKLNWEIGIAGAHTSLGANLANKADYPNALNHEYIALKIYEKLNNRYDQARLLRNIGIVLHTSKNQSKALEYDLKALEIFKELKNQNDIALMYGNIANVYYTLKDKNKVVEYNFKALDLYKELKDQHGIARTLGNLANFYAIEADFSKAMFYYFGALRLEKDLSNKNGITRNMGNIGETYLDIYRNYSTSIKPDSLIPFGKPANLQKALDFLKFTIDNSRTLGQTEYFLAFAEVLSDAYGFSGNTKAALELYKEYISVRDSVYDVEKLNETARKQMVYEYGKREDSISYEKKISDIKLVQEKISHKRENIYFTICLILVLIFSGFLYNRWKLTQKQKKLIEIEKNRSDELLLNILPEEVAEELKAKGSAGAKQFDQVTVMFTDFKGFTQISEKLTAQELVSEIDICFRAFDNIIHKYKIEKIKTIGDSYMCAGGLPVANESHAEDILNAALDISTFMQSHLEERKSGGKPIFEIRIGIHSGPVVAGIVGIKKFAYDIWGDTVNTASRMESTGEAGKINISGSTYQLVRDKFSCIHRGKIQVKSKGDIDMYFVEGIKQNS